MRVRLRVRLVVGLLLLPVPLLLLKRTLLCSHSAISTVCSQVRDGLALGDMCLDLCHHHTISPDGCPSYHRGKEVVFSAQFRQSLPVVAKARSLDLETDSEHVVYWTTNNGSVQFSDIADFQQALVNHLQINYNISLPKNKGLSSIWPHSLHKESLSEVENEWLRHNSMKNIWTLSLDPEFVYSRIFKEYDVFPEVYGTCGGLFFVEKLQPLDMPYFLQSVDFGGWVTRVKLALAILDLVEEFDEMFEFPVHLCDVKSEHFGLSSRGRVKYLDSDNVYLGPTADRSVGDGSHCHTDADCHLFDCEGHCDLAQNTCTGAVRNSNLQVVCKKIFLAQNLGLKFMGGTGLLLSQHASAGLLDTLQTCANMRGGSRDQREQVRDSLRQRLKEVIFISQQMD